MRSGDMQTLVESFQFKSYRVSSKWY